MGKYDGHVQDIPMFYFKDKTVNLQFKNNQQIINRLIDHENNEL